MHGYYKENIGIYPFDFNDKKEFLDYLNHSALFTAERQEEILYFEPIQAKDYLKRQQIEAKKLNGQQVFIKPEEKDFKNHRAYHYQSLTKRGTVEFRSICTQPLERTFAPAAFHLGLFVNLDELENYLEHSEFFEKYGRDYQKLRRHFSKKKLTINEENDIVIFAQTLLKLSEKGLKKRGKYEERYLNSLFSLFH